MSDIGNGFDVKGELEALRSEVAEERTRAIKEARKVSHLETVITNIDQSLWLLAQSNRKLTDEVNAVRLLQEAIAQKLGVIP